MSYPAQRFIDAAKDGYLDVLQQATKRDLNTADEDGMTAVFWAAHSGHLDALRLIIGRGGEVDRCDYLGMTPLHHAAQKGFLHVVTYLVNWGANMYSLDNGHHSPLDLASLYEKAEVVQYLDEVYGQQYRKNPKNVNRLKEEAVKQAEKNIRRYEKLQDEAARRAQKEQRRLQSTVSNDSGASASQNSTIRKQNIFKTFTLALRGNKTQRKTVVPAGKSYSDFAGLTTGKSGAARRINQRRAAEYNGTMSDRGDFKISDVDESGKRTVRSLKTGQGVVSKTSEVMYLTNRGDTTTSDTTASRPAVYDVFGHNRSNLYKAKSESDLLDSGVDSYQDEDEYDEENKAGIFNRPGFGATAFLTGNKFLSTLHSFDGQLNDDDWEPDVNGLTPMMNGDMGGHDDPDNVLVGRPKELPWDQEEMDTLDDDEATTTSAIETFLWTAQLEGYLHIFLQEKVDMEILVRMSDAEFKEIGLPLGPRKKLLDAIKRRQDVLTQNKLIKDSFL